MSRIIDGPTVINRVKEQKVFFIISQQRGEELLRAKASENTVHNINLNFIKTSHLTKVLRDNKLAIEKQETLNNRDLTMIFN